MKLSGWFPCPMCCRTDTTSLHCVRLSFAAHVVELFICAACHARLLGFAKVAEPHVAKGES